MPISNYIINNYIIKLSQSSKYTQSEVNKIKYTLQSIFWEMEKVCLLIIMFAILNNLELFGVLYFALISIRVNAGGFHCKTNTGCMIFSSLFFLTIIYFFPNPLAFSTAIPLLLISLCITGIFAPVCSKERMKLVHNLQQKRMISITCTLFWIAFVIINVNTLLASHVTWLLFLQNITLLAEVLKRKEVISYETGIKKEV